MKRYNLIQHRYRLLGNLGRMGGEEKSLKQQIQLKKIKDFTFFGEGEEKGQQARQRRLSVFNKKRFVEAELYPDVARSRKLDQNWTKIHKTISSWNRTNI